MKILYKMLNGGNPWFPPHCASLSPLSYTRKHHRLKGKNPFPLKNPLFILWYWNFFKFQYHKIITWPLVIIFLLQSIGWTAPSISPQSMVHSPQSIYIPEQYGKIEKSIDSPKSPTVILVKDAHCNYEAQTNIAKILDTLIRDYEIDLVGTEGASGFVNPQIVLESNPKEELRKKVSDKFLKTGLLTASEALSINKGKEPGFTIWGAEDLKLYLKDYRAFRDTIETDPSGKRFIELLINLIGQLKKKIYPESARKFDNLVKDYESNKLPLTKFIKILHRNYGIQKQHKNLKIVLKSVKLEKTIDFTKVEKERAGLIKELEKSLPKEDLQELIKKSLLFKLGKIPAVEYYSYLAQFNNLQLITYNLKLYTRLVKLQDRIDETKLFNELEDIIERIFLCLCTDKPGRELRRLDKDINIINKILTLEATRENLSYYKNNQARFTPEKLLEFIKIQAPLNNITLPSELNDPSFIEDVRNAIIPAGEFYKLAIERDTALVENLLHVMAKNKKNKAALVCGGFHAEGVKKLLQDRGIEVLTITPSITKIQEDSRELYLKRMMDERINPENILRELGLENLGPPLVTNTCFKLELSGPIIDAFRATHGFAPKAEVSKEELIEIIGKLLQVYRDAVKNNNTSLIQAIKSWASDIKKKIGGKQIPALEEILQNAEYLPETEGRISRGIDSEIKVRTGLEESTGPKSLSLENEKYKNSNTLKEVESAFYSAYAILDELLEIEGLTIDEMKQAVLKAEELFSNTPKALFEMEALKSIDVNVNNEEEEDFYCGAFTWRNKRKRFELQYSEEILNDAKKFDNIKPDSNSYIEFLFHEPLCHVLTEILKTKGHKDAKKLGHNIAKLIQKGVFINNYGEGDFDNVLGKIIRKNINIKVLQNETTKAKCLFIKGKYEEALNKYAKIQRAIFKLTENRDTNEISNILFGIEDLQKIRNISKGCIIINGMIEKDTIENNMKQIQETLNEKRKTLEEAKASEDKKEAAKKYFKSIINNEGIEDDLEGLIGKFLEISKEDKSISMEIRRFFVLAYKYSLSGDYNRAVMSIINALGEDKIPRRRTGDKSELGHVDAILRGLNLESLEDITYKDLERVMIFLTEIFKEWIKQGFDLMIKGKYKEASTIFNEILSLCNSREKKIFEFRPKFPYKAKEIAEEMEEHIRKNLNTLKSTDFVPGIGNANLFGCNIKKLEEFTGEEILTTDEKKALFNINSIEGLENIISQIRIITPAWENIFNILRLQQYPFIIGENENFKLDDYDMLIRFMEDRVKYLRLPKCPDIFKRLQDSFMTIDRIIIEANNEKYGKGLDYMRTKVLENYINEGNIEAIKYIIERFVSGSNHWSGIFNIIINRIRFFQKTLWAQAKIDKDLIREIRILVSEKVKDEKTKINLCLNLVALQKNLIIELDGIGELAKKRIVYRLDTGFMKILKGYSNKVKRLIRKHIMRKVIKEKEIDITLDRLIEKALRRNKDLSKEGITEEKKKNYKNKLITEEELRLLNRLKQSLDSFPGELLRVIKIQEPIRFKDLSKRNAAGLAYQKEGGGIELDIVSKSVVLHELFHKASFSYTFNGEPAIKEDAWRQIAKDGGFIGYFNNEGKFVYIKDDTSSLNEFRDISDPRWIFWDKNEGKLINYVPEEKFKNTGKLIRMKPLPAASCGVSGLSISSNAASRGELNPQGLNKLKFWEKTRCQLIPYGDLVKYYDTEKTEAKERDDFNKLKTIKKNGNRYIIVEVKRDIGQTTHAKASPFELVAYAGVAYMDDRELREQHPLYKKDNPLYEKIMKHLKNHLCTFIEDGILKRYVFEDGKGYAEKVPEEEIDDSIIQAAKPPADQFTGEFTICRPPTTLKSPGSVGLDEDAGAKKNIEKVIRETPSWEEKRDNAFFHILELGEQLGIPRKKGAVTPQDLVYAYGKRETRNKKRETVLNIYVTEAFWKILEKDHVMLAFLLDHEYQENIVLQNEKPKERHRIASQRAWEFVDKYGMNPFYRFFIDRLAEAGDINYLKKLIDKHPNDPSGKFRDYILETLTIKMIPKLQEELEKQITIGNIEQIESALSKLKEIHSVIEELMTEGGSLSTLVFEKLENILFDILRKGNVDAKLNMMCISLPMSLLNPYGYRIANDIKEGFYKKVKKYIADKKPEELGRVRRFFKWVFRRVKDCFLFLLLAMPAKVRNFIFKILPQIKFTPEESEFRHGYAQLSGQYYGFSRTRLFIIGLNENDFKDVKRLFEEALTEAGIADTENYPLFAGHMLISLTDRKDIQNEFVEKSYKLVSGKIEDIIIDAIKETTGRAEVAEKQLGETEKAETKGILGQKHESLLSKYEYIIMKGRDKFIPENEYETGKIPRLSHQIGYLDKLYEELENGLIQKDVMKKYKEYISILNKNILRAFQDTRYKRAYKKDSAGAVIMAWNDGALSDYIEYLRKKGLKDLAAEWDYPLKMTKIGDEIWLYLKINNKITQIFIELDKFNAFNEKYPPDRRDSFYHQILDIIFNYYETNKDNPAQFVNGLEDAILDTPIRIPEGEIYEIRGKPTGADDIITFRELVFHHTEKFKGQRVPIYTEEKEVQKRKILSYKERIYTAEGKEVTDMAELSPIIAPFGVSIITDWRSLSNLDPYSISSQSKYHKEKLRPKIRRPMDESEIAADQIISILEKHGITGIDEKELISTIIEAKKGKIDVDFMKLWSLIKGRIPPEKFLEIAADISKPLNNLLGQEARTRGAQMLNAILKEILENLPKKERKKISSNKKLTDEEKLLLAGKKVAVRKGIDPNSIQNVFDLLKMIRQIQRIDQNADFDKIDSNCFELIDQIAYITDMDPKTMRRIVFGRDIARSVTGEIKTDSALVPVIQRLRLYRDLFENKSRGDLSLDDKDKLFPLDFQKGEIEQNTENADIKYLSGLDAVSYDLDRAYKSIENLIPKEPNQSAFISIPAGMFISYMELIDSGKRAEVAHNPGLGAFLDLIKCAKIGLRSNKDNRELLQRIISTSGLSNVFIQNEITNTDGAINLRDTICKEHNILPSNVVFITPGEFNADESKISNELKIFGVEKDSALHAILLFGVFYALTENVIENGRISSIVLQALKDMGADEKQIEEIKRGGLFFTVKLIRIPDTLREFQNRKIFIDVAA